jgi:hypothetical protein
MQETVVRDANPSHVVPDQLDPIHPIGESDEVDKGQYRAVVPYGAIPQLEPIDVDVESLRNVQKIRPEHAVFPSLIYRRLLNGRGRRRPPCEGRSIRAEAVTGIRNPGHITQNRRRSLNSLRMSRLHVDLIAVVGRTFPDRVIHACKRAVERAFVPVAPVV